MLPPFSITFRAYFLQFLTPASKNLLRKPNIRLQIQTNSISFPLIFLSLLIYQPLIYFSTANLTNVEMVKFLSFAYFCTFSNITSPNTFRQNIVSLSFQFFSIFIQYRLKIFFFCHFSRFFRFFYIIITP